MSFMDGPDGDFTKVPVLRLQPVRNWLETMEAARQLRSELRNVPRFSEAASRSEIETLVEHQLGPWRNVRFKHSSLMYTLRKLNRQSWSAFIVRIKGRKISVWKKFAFWYPASQSVERKRQSRAIGYRLAVYRVMLQEVIERYGIDADMTLALDVDDRGATLPDVPVFTFQKDESSRNILLPDTDFFRMHWYTLLQDECSYDEKAIKAVFAGSSTGGRISEKIIADRALPRLRSAAHFVGNPLVDFRITKVVQCDTDAGAALLKQQPYFRPWTSWDEQLRYRFLLSMDGNAAAWSRLVIALQSNSAVIKYRSPSTLYYFPAMLAGREYIDVRNDQEVEDVVRTELRSPRRFKPVAQAGRAFAARYLNKASVLDYTAALLTDYARICRQ